MTLSLKPLPNEEALAFWKDKVRMGAGTFSRLRDDAKVRAFAVSGIAKGAELEQVFNSFSRALEEGTPFSEWKKSLADVWEKRGWTGVKAWRLETIFRTNIQTAFHVGRYQQMSQVAATRPYWMYDAVNDSRTRPEHRALNGKVYRHDHPFWDTWYPPNGFRCRCGVTTLSQREIERDGLTVETKDVTGTLIEPTTPEGVRMPARPLMPDPGFAHHPGKTVWGGMVDDRMAQGKNLTQFDNLKGAADYRIPSAANLKNLLPAPALLPSLEDLKAGGMSNSQASRFYLEKFREAFGLDPGMEKAFDVIGETVIASERLITGKGGRVKITKGDRGQYIPLFRDTVLDPDEMWLTPMKDDAGKIILRRRHFKFWRGDGENLAGFSVMDIDGGVWTGISVYDVQEGQTTAGGASLLDSPNGYRRGMLLYRRKK